VVSRPNRWQMTAWSASVLSCRTRVSNNSGIWWLRWPQPIPGTWSFARFNLCARILYGLPKIW
jgi:hypothetical protein